MFWPLTVRVPLDWYHAAVPQHQYSGIHILGWVLGPLFIINLQRVLWKKEQLVVLSNLKKNTQQNFLVFGLILTLILLSCFSGVFFTLVNHLITKLSWSWLEHANGSVRTITLHFRVSWFHDDFLQLRRITRVESERLGYSAESWKPPQWAFPLSPGPVLTLLALSVPLRLGHSVYTPSLCLQIAFLLAPGLLCQVPILGYIVLLGSQPLLLQRWIYLSI